MSLMNLPVFALIPARGGSKGVPRKNLSTVGGETLVQRAIKIAKSSKGVDEIYLSSDDEDILNIGRDLKVNVLKRPPEFASDEATAVQVVHHFLIELPKTKFFTDAYIVYLQPTSPLRTAKHLEDAFALMQNRQRHFLVSVSEMEKSPFKSFLVGEDGLLQSLFEEEMSNLRRQDLPTVFIPNGAIYVFRVSDFLDRKGFPSNGGLPFIMSSQESIDVDSEEDLKKANQTLGEQYGRV